MRIKIINPNTTASFTELCLSAGRAVAAAGTQLLAGQPSSGTPSVECHVDEAIATLGVVEQVRAGEAAQVDGYVIACFGDTGIAAAREVATGPVVGMTEAALCAAALIAPVFSIVTLPARTRVFAERVLCQAGLQPRCARVRTIDIDVLEACLVLGINVENPATGFGVTFAGFQGDCKPMYRAADLLIFTSPEGFEGLPQVPLEAMAMGLPCLASDISSIREIAGESGAVVTYRQGNIGDLAEKLSELAANRPILVELGQAGRREIDGRFTESVVAGAYLEQFRLAL